MFTGLIKHYLRNGARFDHYLRECEEIERYSAVELRGYQEERLAEIVREAFNHVPFYRKMFRNLKLTPSDIKSIEDLHKIPTISKRTVVENFAQFGNETVKGLRQKVHTGGTTGSPGMFLRDRNSIEFEQAVLWRQLRWAGKPSGSRRVVLRGDQVVPLSRTEPPFWKHTRINKELLFSSFHLSDQNMSSYVKAMIDFGAYDLYAYPSTASLLASYCIERNLDLRFSAVFTSSEMLHDFQRKRIEKAFQCRIFDWYGSAERVAAIGHCEHGSYHELPHYGIVEYLPAGDGWYSIVGTGLHNSVMPLIRYELGDFVRMKEGDACPCGRSFKRVHSIVGREEDLVQFPNGHRAVVMESRVFRDIANIKQVQIVQYSLDVIEVLIVKEVEARPIDESSVVERMVKFVGGTREIYRTRIVTRIEREPNGKYMSVKSYLSKGPKDPVPGTTGKNITWNRL